jgi:hypothetical protein
LAAKARPANTARLILEKFIAEFAGDWIANFRFASYRGHPAQGRRQAPERQGPTGRASAANMPAQGNSSRLRYAIKVLDLARPNPVDQAEAIAVPKGGRTWTEDEIEQYRALPCAGHQGAFGARDLPVDRASSWRRPRPSALTPPQEREDQG